MVIIKLYKASGHESRRRFCAT